MCPPSHPSRNPIADELTTDRAHLWLEHPAWGVIITRVEGFASVEVGTRIIAWVDGAIVDGEVPMVFHDWELASGYEPALRPLFTDWYRRVKANTAGVHVLTQSKLVTMGVSLVALATGNAIVAYREREAFEKVVGEALAKARSR